MKRGLYIILSVLFLGCQTSETKTEIQFLFQGNRYGLSTPPIIFSYNAYIPSDYTGAGRPLYNEYLFVSKEDTGHIEIKSTLIKGRDDSCTISDEKEEFYLHKNYIVRRQCAQLRCNPKIYNQQTIVVGDTKLYITLYDGGFCASACVDNLWTKYIFSGYFGHSTFS